MSHIDQQSDRSMSDTWYIGLDAWILADGNYWNGEYHGFYKTQSTLFALEINPWIITAAPIGEKRAIHKKETHYTFTGEVAFVWENGWIIDFGVYAYFYCRSKPSYIPPLHSFIAIDTFLSIDHFAYSDFLHKIPGIPPLIYQWYIQQVIHVNYGCQVGIFPV